MVLEPCLFEQATICSYSRSILVLSNGGCALHPQEHPIVHKLLHLNDFQSFEYGILGLVGIGHGLLVSGSFCIYSLIGSPDNILCLLAFSHIDVHDVFTS